MPREKTCKVEVPAPGDDRARLGRVGIIAGIGFVVGILWPWLAGVQLVPGLPEDEAPASAPAAASPSASAAPAVASAAPAAEADTTEKESSPSVTDRVKPGKLKVTSCRGAAGERTEKCDDIAFDRVAQGPLHALATCSGTETAQGMLSLGFRVDFAQKKIVDYLRGASTTLPDRIANALLECAKKEFSSVSLDQIEHEQSEYTVFYLIEFLPPGSRPSEEATPDQGSEATAASGMATVTWNVAIVRSEPKQESELVDRVASGTRVAVVERQGDWYKVKYDAKGNEGWVYKGAIGL